MVRSLLLCCRHCQIFAMDSVRVILRKTFGRVSVADEEYVGTLRTRRCEAMCNPHDIRARRCTRTVRDVGRPRTDTLLTSCVKIVKRRGSARPAVDYVLTRTGYIAERRWRAATARSRPGNHCARRLVWLARAEMRATTCAGRRHAGVRWSWKGRTANDAHGTVRRCGVHLQRDSVHARPGLVVVTPACRVCVKNAPAESCARRCVRAEGCDRRDVGTTRWELCRPEPLMHLKMREALRCALRECIRRYGQPTRGGVFPVVGVQRGDVSSWRARGDVKWEMMPGVLFSLTRLITRVHVTVDAGSGRVAVEAEWTGGVGLTSPIYAGCGLRGARGWTRCQIRAFRVVASPSGARRRRAQDAGPGYEWNFVELPALRYRRRRG
ncbi:hypothetical protein C8R44DRAFT_732067 [Mycena epipterygia]|nr:hypothetical protein C8R44DRAFT_732067 [Mycena epipterygia]